MKIAKKLLVVVLALAMVSAFAAMSSAAGATVSFDVGELENGEAEVVMYLVNAVGLQSGQVNLKYDNKVSAIEYEDGADVDGAGKLGNTFLGAFNPAAAAGEAQLGLLFQDELYDTAKWAELAANSRKGKDVVIDGSNFEVAVFYIKATDGAVVNVTGELKMADGTSTDVSTSFTIGTAAPETTTAKTTPVETTTAKTTPAETTTAKTTPAETTTAKTTPAETTTAKSSAGETTTAKSSSTETTTAKTTPSKTTPGQKTDNGKKTGDNSVLAVMAGVIALAGAAFVVTKKRK